MTSISKLSKANYLFILFYTSYILVVGVFQYTIIIISYTINKDCDFVDEAFKSHWTTSKQNFHYLKNELQYGFNLYPKSLVSFFFQVFCDV